MTKSKISSKSLIHNLFILILLVLFIFALIKPFVKEFGRDTKPLIKDKAQVPVEVVKVIEKPLHDVSLPNFAAIRDVKEKKRQFFDFLRPEVERENQRLTALRQQMMFMLEKVSLEQPLSEREQLQIDRLAKKYRISKKFSQLQKVSELTKRIDMIPSALILVQAANESAWGTSRFARIGLNFFGIWCYQKGCGMVPNGRNVGAKHEVAAFPSVEAAVKRYLHNINTNNAYQVFRTIRAQLHQQNQPLSAQILATGLLSYSERGSDYVLEITQMIRHNQSYLGEKIAE